MAAEIERKFHLEQAPSWVSEQESRQIEQGYLALADEVEVRIRIADGEPLLTVKRGGGEVREEAEVPLNEKQLDALWPFTDSLRLAKTRYSVPLRDRGLTAEVDVYAGDLEGLVVAEVEFDSPEASEGFQPPDWLGTEVTGDDRFANQSLARDGRPADA